MSMQMNQCVSVIIPCFNQGRFLAEAIDSVLSETYSNTEIIIVNDGSDGQYRRGGAELWRTGPCISSRPIPAHRDRATGGLSEARGDFIQFLDADDVLLPTKLEKQMKLLAGSAGLRVAYCNYYFGETEHVYERAKVSFTPLSACFNHTRPLKDLILSRENGTVGSHTHLPVRCAHIPYA